MAYRRIAPGWVRKRSGPLAALLSIAALGGCAWTESDWGRFWDHLNRLDRACVAGYVVKPGVLPPGRDLFYPRFRSFDDRPIPAGLRYKMAVRGRLALGESRNPYVELRRDDLVAVTDDHGDILYETRAPALTLTGYDDPQYFVTIEARSPLAPFGRDQDDCHVRHFTPYPFPRGG